MSTAHNILVTSHGHPDFSLGGGEIAAYELFKSYSSHASVGQATFWRELKIRRVGLLVR